MAQTVKLWDTYHIPTYAICALENGDYDGDLDEKDIENIKEFEEYLVAQCPHGYTLEWKDIDNPYFSSNPQFGLPVDVVDCAVYKIIKYDETKLTKAPIDYSNISPEFDWLHDGSYLSCEFAADNENHEMFWNNGCCCMLNYEICDNWFAIIISDSFCVGNLEAAEKDILQRCFGCTDMLDNVLLKYESESGLYDHRVIKGRFYYMQEE